MNRPTKETEFRMNNYWMQDRRKWMCDLRNVENLSDKLCAIHVHVQ